MDFLNGVQKELERYREAYRLAESELIKRDQQLLAVMEELKSHKEPVSCREVEKALRAEIKRLEAEVTKERQARLNAENESKKRKKRRNEV